jgi:hypothetical protein
MASDTVMPTRYLELNCAVNQEYWGSISVFTYNYTANGHLPDGAK